MIIEPTSIQTDEATKSYDEADAAEAFLRRMTEDDEGPSEDTSEKDAPEDGADEDEPDQETEEPSQDDAADPDEDEADNPDEPAVADDTAMVEVKVGDEVKRVSVADLKRLFGQESALTKRSQEVAAMRKRLDDESLKTAATLQKLRERAVERFKPYEKVDLFKASRELEPDEFDALRKEMDAAQADVKFLDGEIDAFMADAKRQHDDWLRAQAPKALQTITKAIPDWTDQVYDKVRSFAVSAGMEPDTVNKIVDPAAIILMYKAMKYDEGSSAVKQKVKPQGKSTPKRTVTKSNRRDSAPSQSKRALDRLRTSGDLEDAAAAYLSRLE